MPDRRESLCALSASTHTKRIHPLAGRTLESRMCASTQVSLFTQLAKCQQAHAKVWKVPDCYNSNGENVTDGHARIGYSLAEAAEHVVTDHLTIQ